jgi:hypothetical protein
MDIQYAARLGNIGGNINIYFFCDGPVVLTRVYLAFYNAIDTYRDIMFHHHAGNLFGVLKIDLNTFIERSRRVGAYIFNILILQMSTQITTE